MKIVRTAAYELFVREWFDPLRFDQHYVVRILYLAFDQEKWLFRYQQSQLLEKIGRDDRIGNAGFIFEADEHKSFRRPRPLTTDHIARDLHRCAVSCLRQINCSPGVWQLLAQELHRVRTGREVHRFVIRLDTLRQGHARERRLAHLFGRQASSLFRPTGFQPVVSRNRGQAARPDGLKACLPTTDFARRCECAEQRQSAVATTTTLRETPLHST